jgi:hypothetical protein
MVLVVERSLQSSAGACNSKSVSPMENAARQSARRALLPRNRPALE